MSTVRFPSGCGGGGREQSVYGKVQMNKFKHVFEGVSVLSPCGVGSRVKKFEEVQVAVTRGPEFPVDR